MDFRTTILVLSVDADGDALHRRIFLLRFTHDRARTEWNAEGVA